MKIGMVLDGYFPGDIRVAKEIDGLEKKGHQVALLCRRRPGEEMEEVLDSGLEIQRVNAGKNLYTFTIFQTINAAIYLHPVFYFALFSFIRNQGVQVLHLHDLPLFKTCYRVAKKLKLPLVLDLHENFPAAYPIWYAQKKNPIVRLKNRLFFNYTRWYNYEKFAAEKCDKLIVVVNEMRDRIIKEHAIPAEKIKVVGNTEIKSFATLGKDFPEVKKHFEGYFTLCYIGGFGPHRGLHTMIEMLPHAIDIIPNIKLIFIGKGSIKPYLVSLAEKLGVSSHIEFISFQPFEKICSFMKYADINIIPHAKNEHTDHTIPHKLFQAMLVGKPVLVSDVKPLKRIIEETDGGVIFKAEDPSDLSEKVLFIKNNSKALKQKCANALKATIEGKYNWEHDAEHLVQLYEELKSQPEMHNHEIR